MYGIETCTKFNEFYKMNLKKFRSAIIVNTGNILIVWVVSTNSMLKHRSNEHMIVSLIHNYQEKKLYKKYRWQAHPSFSVQLRIRGESLDAAKILSKLLGCSMHLFQRFDLHNNLCELKVKYLRWYKSKAVLLMAGFFKIMLQLPCLQYGKLSKNICTGPNCFKPLSKTTY